MQTKNLIQASANVIKITSLVKGDVIKMVEESSYSTPEIYYGVVLDLLNDGDKTFIQIMRYKKGYASIDTDIKTYNGSKDLSIFPATVKEIEEELQSAINQIETSIKEEEKKLASKKEALKTAKDFVSYETSRQLSEVNYKEISTQEFKQLKIEAENKRKVAELDSSNDIPF